MRGVIEKDYEVNSIPVGLDFWLSDQIKFSELTSNVKKGIQIEVINLESLVDIESYSINNSKETGRILANLYLDRLNKISFDELIERVISVNNTRIKPANIPQFSNFNDASIRLLEILRKSGDFGASFDELGRYLTEPGKKVGAYKKYGENHSKMLNMLDLVYIEKDKCQKVYLTFLGMELQKRDNYSELIAKITIKIPIVRELICKALYEDVKVEDILNKYLAKTTSDRRKPNVKFLINLIREHYKEEKYKNVLERIN